MERNKKVIIESIYVPVYRNTVSGIILKKKEKKEGIYAMWDVPSIWMFVKCALEDLATGIAGIWTWTLYTQSDICQYCIGYIWKVRVSPMGEGSH